MSQHRPISLPGRLERLAFLYYQLAQMLETGIPIMQATHRLASLSSHSRERKALSIISQQMEVGLTFSEAIDNAGPWLQQLDKAVIKAGEISGRLPDCLRLLAEYHSLQARLLRQMASSLFYPAILLCALWLLFPTHYLQQLVLAGDVVPFLVNKLKLAALAFLLLSILILAQRFGSSNPIKVLLQELGLSIPVLRQTLVANAMARLSFALHILLEAGISAPQAWRLAASTVGLQRLSCSIQKAARLMDAGVPPSEALTQTRAVPEKFLTMYATGELSGKLDDSLTHLFAFYSEEAKRLLERLATRLPLVLYIALVLVVAHQIISFWSGYAKML